MAIKVLNTSINSNRNNGGVIFYGGNILSDSKVRSIDMRAAGYRDEKYGSTPIVNVNNKAISNSVKFGKVTANDYIIKGLANTNINLTLKQSSDYRRHSVHYNWDLKTRKIVTTGWNYFTGQPLTTPVPVTTDNMIRSGNAVIENRATPGKFVFQNGSPTLFRSNYSAKTG